MRTRARFVALAAAPALAAAAGASTCVLGCEGLRAYGLSDASTADAGDALDASDAAAPYDAQTYPLAAISGGPCASGAPGATAFRILWLDDHGAAVAKVERLGLSDSASFHATAFAGPGGTTPAFDDNGLGPGGVAIDSTNGVDIAFSMRGVPHIRSARVSILGRSFDTGSPGSFAWAANHDEGHTPPGGISNGVPYEWTGADLTGSLDEGQPDEHLRIRSGPPSLSLVIQRIELCLDTDPP